MTKAKKSAGTAVAPRSTAVVAGSWRERAASSVARARGTIQKLPAQTGNFLSLRGGTISHGGVTLTNPLPVVILDIAFERSYYSSDYQPDVMTVPDCYSYDGEAPHEKASVPQADRCAECRFNEFGSARNGNGKGCKEGGKLVMIHADALKSPELIAAAPMVQARLSVLNAKKLRAYIDALGDEPVWADITYFHNQPDPKSQYAVNFVRGNVVIEEDVLDAIAAREDEAIKLLDQPYPDKEELPQRAAPARRTAAAPSRRSRFQR